MSARLMHSDRFDDDDDEETEEHRPYLPYPPITTRKHPIHKEQKIEKQTNAGRSPISTANNQLPKQEIQEPVGPAWKITRQSNPYEGIKQRGRDGKPIALQIGVLKDRSRAPVFVKKKTAKNTKTHQLHYYIQLSSLKNTSNWSNSFALTDIKLHSEYNYEDADTTKVRLSSLLSATDFKQPLKRSRREAVDVDSQDDEPDIFGEPAKRMRTHYTQKVRQTSLQSSSPTPIAETANSSREPHEGAIATFKNYLRKIDNNHNQRVEDLQAQIDNAVENGELVVRDARKKIKKLQAENETLRSELESRETVAIKHERKRAPTPPFSMGRNAPWIEENNYPLINRLKEALEEIDKLKEKLRTISNTSVNGPLLRSMTIDGNVYEVPRGDNAGFFRGQNGPLCVEDGVACREFVLLREEKKYIFAGCTEDEEVMSGGGVRREVVSESTDGIRTQHILNQRKEVVREDGKEYTVFDVLKCSFI